MEVVKDLDAFDTSEFSYPIDAPLVFFGHYWIRNKNGAPRVTRAPNVQCLDFSVGGGAGQLGIYRWNGEEELRAENLLAVSAQGDRVFQHPALNF